MRLGYSRGLNVVQSSGSRVTRKYSSSVTSLPSTGAEAGGAAQVVEILAFRAGPAGQHDRRHVVVGDRVADPLGQLEPGFRPRRIERRRRQRFDRRVAVGAPIRFALIGPRQLAAVERRVQCAAKSQALQHFRQQRRERRIELAEDLVLAIQMRSGRLLARDQIPPAMLRAIDTRRRAARYVPPTIARRAGFDRPLQLGQRFRMLARHPLDLLASDQQVRRASRGQFRAQRFAQRRIRQQRDIDDVEVDRVHMVPRIGQQIERAAKLFALSLAIAGDRRLRGRNDRDS